MPARMEDYWDRRAREDPFRYVDNTRWKWSEDMDAFWRTGEEAVDTLFSDLGVELAGNEDVVDIGCGVGRLTRVLAQRARSVHALDVSEEMLVHARQHNSQLTNVQWVHGDGSTLPLPAFSFDACVSFVVFQHLPDPELTYGYIREIGRVLRPRGWAAFQVSNDAQLHRPVSLFRRLTRQMPRRVYRDPAWWGSAVEIPRLRQTANEAGMEIERLTGESTQFCYVLLRRHA